MSIPFEVVRARGQFRAGKITAAEFNKIVWDAGYLRPREAPLMPEDEFRPIGEAAARVVGRLKCQQSE